MYGIQIYELEKPVGEEDNEAVEAGGADCSSEDELIERVKQFLPTLGGTHGRWMEIAVKD